MRTIYSEKITTF